MPDRTADASQQPTDTAMLLTKTLRCWLRPWVPPVVSRTMRPVPHRTEPHFDLPVVDLETIAPGASKMVVRFPASEIPRSRSMVLPLGDLLTLSAIASTRRPKRVFEIGTYTGSTTLVLAMNTPDNADLVTLDLDPEDMPAGLYGPDGRPVYVAGSLFHGTAEASKIQQVYGRSEAFDYTPYHGSFDLVYIDADHSYEAVVRDSRTAFRLVASGGLVVWDDYRWLPEHAECRGVTQALHELAGEYPIHQLSGTRLAVCQAS